MNSAIADLSSVIFSPDIDPLLSRTKAMFNGLEIACLFIGVLTEKPNSNKASLEPELILLLPHFT